MGSLRRHAAAMRAVFTLLLLSSFIASSAGMALASTVGVISGTVTDTATHQPLSNVRVTAASPSGSYRATTDAHGFYSLTGVYADTYTVSFQLPGYQPTSTPGVTAFADQAITLNQQLNKSLKVIATVRSTGAGSAFHPSQTVDTVSIGSQQIQQFQGTSFNFDEVNIISSLPGAELDSSGYPVIHGGREYEEGFEFEGIPYTDAYSNQFTNSLAVTTQGISSVQLTPGGGDITQTSGGFGALNVVAKRGSYPAYAQFGLSVGGPGFDHRATIDYSFATPDGRFSNYASFAGDNRTYNYGNNGYPYAQISRFYSRRMDADREFQDNFVFRFGKNNHESIQAFTDIAMHSFYEGAGGMGGLCYASCDYAYLHTWNGLLNLIPQITPGQIAAISQLYPGQSSTYEYLSCPVPSGLPPPGIAPGTAFTCDGSNRAPFTYWQPNQAFKLEYTNNLNESTFLSVLGYRVNSVTTFDGPSAEGSINNDIYIASQGGMTNGVTVSLQKQLSSKNLMQAGFDISHLHPIDAYLSDSFSLYGSLLGLLNGFTEQYFLPSQFVNPNDPNCQNPFSAANGFNATASGCGWAYQGPYANATQLKFPQFDQVSTVDRQDYSAYVSDKWTPNDRLNVQAGLRLDMATYRLPAPSIDPTYCTTTYLPITWVAPTTFNAADGWKCNAQATFSFDNNAVKPKVFEPQLGISYRLGEDSSLRLTYRKAVQFVPISDVDFGEIDAPAYLKPWGMIPAYEPFGPGTSSCGIPGTAQQPASGQTSPANLAVTCRNFGEQLFWINQNFDGIAYQTARPTTSDNYELTFSHQFTKGALDGVSFSLSPWYRKQHDTVASEASPLIGSNGQPIVANGTILFGPPVLTNEGREFADGIDFNLTREVPYGLSAQLTATYINEFSSVIPLSSSEDFYPTIQPASIALGNTYRVGFLSPFQSTLALSYRTHSGWRINPRYTYNIGYPTGLGLLTAAYVNGVAYNVPNTNAVAGSSPAGPSCYVDPMNPGTFFSPNTVGCSGASETSSPGGKLTPPTSNTDITIEYSPPSSKLTFGVNVDNVFNQIYYGPQYSARYQPLATGIAGPLTGQSTSSINYEQGGYYTYPSAWPQYGSFIKSSGPFVNLPSEIGRSFYFYIQARL